MVVDPLTDADPRHDVGQQHREVQHRAGEDDRDNAGLVDLERDVGGLAAVHASPDDALGELHRDAALTLLDGDDRNQQEQRERDDDGELDVAAFGTNRRAARGQARHDVGEDQDRHPLTDAALGDELAEPHDRGGTGGHRQHDEQHQRCVEVRDQVEVGAVVRQEALAAVVEHERQTGRLHDRQRDGEVTRGLRDLALTDRALVTPFGQLRDHDLEEVDDDRAGDVRHDPEPENGEARERAAGEQVEEAEHARLVGRLLEALHLLEVDARHRDVRPDPVQDDDEQREEDLVPQVGDPEHVEELHVCVLAPMT